MSLAEAIATGDLTRLPSRRQEDWRWTDLRGLIRVAPPPSRVFEGDLPAGPFAGLAAREVRIVNGRGADRIAVADGQDEVVALRVIAAANAGAHVSRLAIEVGEGASLVLLESHEGLGEAYLAETDLDIRLAPGAKLERVLISAQSDDGVVVVLANVALSAGARFAQTILTSGARRERIETRLAHPGAGAQARLDGVYHLTGRRHADLTSVVDHVGVDGLTDQLAKGVVAGQGRAVFQGRILVREGADRTDARMGHHALILSDSAEVDSKPELEIYADDVACAHGNSIGAIDEDALFYARQRGLSETEARALLTQAFLIEVIERIEDEGAREAAGAWAARSLGLEGVGA